MEQTDSGDVELVIEVDPATQAFARLEGEMALMRRAVEHLAAEKGDIRVPDYTATLGEMAQRLGAIAQGMNTIADKPAMQMTPEDFAARMQAAAAQARRDDHIALADAQRQHIETVRTLRALVGDAASIAEQRRRLKWAAGRGLLAGCLLWAILPGFVARILPVSWHLPERIAARTVRAPNLWEAGPGSCGLTARKHGRPLPMPPICAATIAKLSTLANGMPARPTSQCDAPSGSGTSSRDGTWQCHSGP